MLKLDPSSQSWWSNEGPGCKRVPSKDERRLADVENCLVDYIHVEIFQAALQCFVAVRTIFLQTLFKLLSNLITQNIFRVVCQQFKFCSFK